jgi:hypothetical protein
VRTIAKPILLLAVILFAVFAGATLLLNLYLQSQGARSLLNRELSVVAGAPVSISGIFGLPVLGIRISGVSAGENPTQPLLTAKSIRICPDYLSLLKGRLVIERIRINHPAIHLIMGRPLAGSIGSWVNESNSLESFSDKRHSVAVANSTNTNPSETIHPSVTEVAHTPALGSLLHSLSIRNGEFTLHNTNGTSSLAVIGINADAHACPDKGWLGSLKATRVILADHLIIHQISSSLTSTEDLSKLEFKTLQATLGGGALEGTASFDLNPMQPAYALSLKLDHASMPQLLTDATLGSSSAQGSVGGELNLSGIGGQGSTMQGGGSLLCKEAVIKPVDFLKQIGQLLSIDELQLLRLAESKCAFRVVAGHLIIDDLFLRSENLILTAKGPLQSTGDLDLDSRLLFNAKLTGRLRGLLGSQLTPAPEPGYSQVSFHVSGSPMNPKTDLLQRLTGLKIGGDLGGLLQGLFGRPANH